MAYSLPIRNINVHASRYDVAHYYPYNYHRKLAMVGDSNADDLYTRWNARWGRERDTTVRFFGHRGARVTNHNLSTFQEEYLDDIINWEPHYVVLWLAVMT